GSSLIVYPAGEFPKIAKRNGAKLVIINVGSTPLDSLAELKLETKAGQFLPAVVDRIKNS
ncbi:MAG: NAD-dependent protein deacylase, partial [Candidatus Hodarchaeota archaeon]